MNWHIITSGKGGVGKTLISSMLSAYNCFKGNEVLIIDLNEMNADLCRLLATKTFQEDEYLFSELGETLGDFHFERIHNPDLALNYVIGWPNDAFNTFNSKSFQEFFIKINEQVTQEIKNKFGLTIDTVIIDTSYHFCNIFSGEEKYYKTEPFKTLLQTENISIWFIWVYRQILNLIEADQPNPRHIAARTVKERALTIEANVRNDKFGNPFIHVFSPLSIGQTVVEKKLLGRLFQWTKGDNMGIIQPLKKLEDFISNRKIVASTTFREFFNDLKMARKDVRQANQDIEDVNLFFLKVLDTYVSRLPGCPRNVVPLHIYQRKLLGYTEANYGDFLSSIDNLEIYRESFKKAYSVLLAG